MRLITRLETPAEVTNQLETCGHLTPCNGIHGNIYQSKASSCPYMSRQWLAIHKIVSLHLL